MSVPASSSLGPHVNAKSRLGPVVAKAAHVVRRTSGPSFSTQTDTVPTGLFASASKTRFVLEGGATYRLRSMVLAITITVNTAAARLAPVPYWFSRIDYRSGNGSDLIHTAYDDQMYHALASVPEARLPEVLRAANMDGNWRPLEAVAAGTQRTYYLPLLHNPLTQGGGGIHWNAVGHDLHLEMHTRPIVVSGTGTITCQSVEIICGTQTNVSAVDLKTSAKLSASANVQSRHVEYQVQNFPSTVLQAGNTKKFKLDSINGHAVG